MLVKFSSVSELHPCHPISSMENLLIIHLVNNVEIVGFIHVGVKACSSIKKKIPIAVF
jgi:hypothetical protein